MNADDDVEFDDFSLDLSNPSKILSGGDDPGPGEESTSLNVDEGFSLSSKETHQSLSSLDTYAAAMNAKAKENQQLRDEDLARDVTTS